MRNIKALNTHTLVPPYGDVSRDGVLSTEGRHFRLLICAWRRYKGEVRHDMDGLAILDEDNGLILTDCLGSGHPDEARMLYEKAFAEGLPFIVSLVNSSPRARLHLSANGQLLDKHPSASSSPYAVVH